MHRLNGIWSNLIKTPSFANFSSIFLGTGLKIQDPQIFVIWKKSTHKALRRRWSPDSECYQWSSRKLPVGEHAYRENLISKGSFGKRFSFPPFNPKIPRTPKPFRERERVQGSTLWRSASRSVLQVQAVALLIHRTDEAPEASFGVKKKNVEALRDRNTKNWEPWSLPEEKRGNFPLEKWLNKYLEAASESDKKVTWFGVNADISPTWKSAAPRLIRYDDEEFSSPGWTKPLWFPNPKLSLLYSKCELQCHSSQGICVFCGHKRSKSHFFKAQKLRSHGSFVCHFGHHVFHLSPMGKTKEQDGSIWEGKNIV